MTLHGDVYSIQHYVIKVCQCLAAGRWFSPGTVIPSTNKAHRHYITEILLNVVLSTITINIRIQFSSVRVRFVTYHTYWF